MQSINRHYLIRARDLSPDHPTASLSLGKVFLKQRDYRSALDSFLTSLQINPFNPEVHEALGETYEMLGDRDGSLREKEIAKRLAR